MDVLSATGFVYLENDGIDNAIVDQVYKVSKQFFELPVETKTVQYWSRCLWLCWFAKTVLFTQKMMGLIML